MNKTNISLIKMPKTRCKHEPLIDTGVGYYFCPACRSSWTNEELNVSRPAFNDVDDENLYIWDGIVSELEKVKSFKDARKWIVENYCDGDKCHPDIESIEIFKKVGNVVLVETGDPDVCELEVRALDGYKIKPAEQQDIPMDKKFDTLAIVDILNDWLNINNRETISRKNILEIAKLISQSPKEEKE